jgi:hypothetical protein
MADENERTANTAALIDQHGHEVIDILLIE